MLNFVDTPRPPSIQLLAALSAAISAGVSGVAIVLNGALERRARLKEANSERQARSEESRLEREARLHDAARQRSANRKQLLMQEAAKLADWRLETYKRMSETHQRTVILTDPIVLTETYYGWLTHLWKHGKLPEDARIER